MKKKSIPSLDEHMQVLSQMQEVGTDEFFYTRLKGKLQNTSSAQGWVLPVKPAWVLATLLILLLVNGYVLKQEQKEKETAPYTIQEFAKSYDQTINTTY
ncbi:MAG TPA: hypothetical protein VK166_19200 [Chitinophagaceae bacterium]|nr:hypothetical protein [Chitinophagaceae bacterium]